MHAITLLHESVDQKAPVAVVLPKLMGPSIACIPFDASHCLAASKKVNAASLLFMTSKKPIPPVFCLYTADRWVS
jgi:hypothetical protein